MSVDQLPTRQPPRRTDDAKLVRYEDFIESKIQSTRWMVKAVDLATALVMLVASVLAYLLVVAVAEHWIVRVIHVVGEPLFVVLVIGVDISSINRLALLVHIVRYTRGRSARRPTLKTADQFVVFRSNVLVFGCRVSNAGGASGSTTHMRRGNISRSVAVDSLGLCAPGRGCGDRTL
jgi:hypothetical protein